MNRYLDVQWIHEDEEYPIRLVSEIGPDGYEIRKLDIFIDGSVDYSDENISSGDCDLSDQKIPSLAEINSQSEFDGVELNKEQFEILWAQHVTKYRHCF